MNISTNQQINFKWNRTTHLEMTLLALKDSNIDISVQRQLARYSQMPDLSKKERGFYNNTHFFFPNKKNKSFGFGKNKYNNALAMFKEHYQNALIAKNKEDFLRNTGYALHYLQDVSVPLHTQSGSIIHKIFNYTKHGIFEKGKKSGATAKLHILKQNFKKEDLTYNSLIDLFVDTANFSQKPEFKVSWFNKNKWPYIQQECFNKGTNITRIFIEKLMSCRNDAINF